MKIHYGSVLGIALLIATYAHAADYSHKNPLQEQVDQLEKRVLLLQGRHENTFRAIDTVTNHWLQATICAAKLDDQLASATAEKLFAMIAAAPQRIKAGLLTTIAQKVETADALQRYMSRLTSYAPRTLHRVTSSSHSPSAEGGDGFYYGHSDERPLADLLRSSEVELRDFSDYVMGKEPAERLQCALNRKIAVLQQLSALQHALHMCMQQRIDDFTRDAQLLIARLSTDSLQRRRSSDPQRSSSDNLDGLPRSPSLSTLRIITKSRERLASPEGSPVNPGASYEQVQDTEASSPKSASSSSLSSPCYSVSSDSAENHEVSDWLQSSMMMWGKH